MKIHGLTLANYRSFGANEQRLHGCSKINVIIGPNNCGKSNIIRAISRLLPSIHGRHNASTKYNQFLDGSTYSPGANSILGLVLSPDSISLDRIGRTGQGVDDGLEQLKQILRSHKKSVFLRAERAANEEWKFSLDPTDIDELLEVAQECGIRPLNIAQAICGQWHPHDAKNNLSAALMRVSPFRSEFRCEIIPAIRGLKHVEHSDSEQPRPVNGAGMMDLAGSGLINRLFQFQNPTATQQDQRKRFDQLIEFLKLVTGDTDASLQIPHTRDTINVKLEGRILPLESLGSGIEQIIIVAAWATAFDEFVLGLEEPEAHLHPVFQRKLIQYLVDSTSNQYFITTHSGNIIDIPGTSVYSVELGSQGSAVRMLEDPSHRYYIAFSLGYRASDLAQSNCVIWVEGPTDRLLLLRALTEAAEDLEEGVHFSIMFYGGRLLRHLTASDEEISEFIRVSRINRRAAILIDSDRKRRDSEISDTKKRIASEAEKSKFLIWITEGREIENYISRADWYNAVREEYDQVREIKDQRYGDFARARDDDREIDKLKVFKRLIRMGNIKFELDWDERLAALISYIRKSN